MDVSMPCVLRANDELTLLQYPGRTHDVRHVAPIEVKVKQENRILEITESLTGNGPNFDDERADHLATSVDGHDDAQTNESRFFPNRKFDHIRLSGQEIATRGSYYAGIVKNGKLILFPIRTMYQLRPQLNYMDKAARKLVEIRDVADSTDDDEVPVKTIHATISRNQDQSVNRKNDQKNFQNRQREILEEEWKKLNMFNDEPLTSSYGEMTSSIKTPEFCSIEGYLEKLSHQPEISDVKVERPVRDKVLEFIWDGQAVTYTTLLNKFHEYADELDSCLVSLCWVVNGYFTAKGIVRHRNDIRMANARDRICYAINKNIVEINSQTKKSSVSNLATCGADNKWLLITPPDTAADLHSDQKSELIAEIMERLEQRMATLKKCRSPSRSPARSAPKTIPKLTPKHIPVKSSPQSPTAKVEFQSNNFKTEPMEQVGHCSTQNYSDIKSERTGSASPTIFTGPSISETEAITNSICRIMRASTEPCQLISTIVTELGLKNQPDEDMELKNGCAILYFPDKLAYCDNEREKCIMELYRALMQQSAKVKRIELWNRVQSSEHPISQKYFDSVLRRESSKPVAVCFGSFGQLLHWVPEIKKYPIVTELLPGPVTIVLPRPERIPSHVNPTCKWIGVRIPDNQLSQQLCADTPLCLTSANKSGQSSAITANDFAELHDRLDAVIDCGRIEDSNLSRGVVWEVMEGSLAVRALQLSAYSAAIDALRASGQNNEQTQKLIQSLQNVFKISETRHSAEVRRACADEKLADLERRSTGRDSSGNWLRRCRRPIPASSTPIGSRSRMRQSLADKIIDSVLTSKTDLKPVHVVLDSPIKSEVEEVELTTSKKKAETPMDTTITLPGGTVLRIGEERPELNKPGRKRKGELVIKEVIESKRPTRNRKFPAKFRRSPDKKAISTALKTARKRLNVERVLIPSPPKIVPKQIKIEATTNINTTNPQPTTTKLLNNNHISKVEVTKPVVPVTQSHIQNGIMSGEIKAISLTTTNSTNGRMAIVGTATPTAVQHRRLSKDDKCDSTSTPVHHQVKAENVATVITVNPISVTHAVPNAQPLALIQTTNNGSNTVFAQSTPTIVVAPASRNKTPSTPFLMNDILKGGSTSEKKPDARPTSVPQVQIYPTTPSSTSSVGHQAQHRPPVIAPNNTRPTPTSIQSSHRKSIHDQSLHRQQSSVQQHGSISRPLPTARSQEKPILQPHRSVYARPTLTPPDQRRTMVSTPHSPISNSRQPPQMRPQQTIILPQIPTTQLSHYGIPTNTVLSLSPGADHRIGSNQHLIRDQRSIMSNAGATLRQLQPPYLLSPGVTPQLQIPHIQLAQNTISPHYIQFPTGQIPLERLQNSNNR